MPCKRSTTANWSKAKLRKFINNNLAGESSVGISPELSTGDLTITGDLTLAVEKKIIWNNENFTGITTNSYGEMQFAQHNAYMGFLFYSAQDPRYNAGSLMVQNTQDSAWGPHLKLWKNRNSAWAAAGTEEDDHLGSIDFVGFDSADSGAPNFPDTTFASIESYALSVTNNDCDGQILMKVMNPNAANDTLVDLLHIGGSDDGGSQNCAVVINDVGIDSDFRVESDVNPSAIFLQGTDGDFRLNFGSSHSPGNGVGNAGRLDILVRKVNFEVITTILIDIDGLRSSPTDNDVIGDDGETSDSDAAYIFSVGNGTPAGWIYKAEMICLEAPAGTNASTDIDLSASTIGTFNENDDVTGDGTRIKLIDAGEAWSGGMRKESSTSTTFTSGLGSNYIYLTAGNSSGGDAEYTAGKFAIKLHGIQSF